jgi:hypothetical protein
MDYAIIKLQKLQTPCQKKALRQRAKWVLSRAEQIAKLVASLSFLSRSLHIQMGNQILGFLPAHVLLFRLAISSVNTQITSWGPSR